MVVVQNLSRARVFRLCAQSAWKGRSNEIETLSNSFALQNHYIQWTGMGDEGYSLEDDVNKTTAVGFVLCAFLDPLVGSRREYYLGNGCHEA